MIALVILTVAIDVVLVAICCLRLANYVVGGYWWRWRCRLRGSHLWEKYGYGYEYCPRCVKFQKVD